MNTMQNYTSYLLSRFSITTSSQLEKKIKDFISAHKLPKSYYFELRSREMDKRLIQTKTLVETLRQMSEQRSLIIEWNLAMHLKRVTKSLKIYTKSAGAVNYVVDNYKKTHLLLVIYIPERQFVKPLGQSFKICDRLCLATAAADQKEILLSTSLNNDKKYPLGNGWPGINAEIGMAAPIMKTNDQVLAVIELTKVIHSTEYSFIDVEAVSLLTALFGYLAEETERVSEIQMSLTFINPMMKLITEYLECALSVAGILSQLTFMNKGELRATQCSFAVMKNIRDRKFNLIYSEDIENPHSHIQMSRMSSENDKSILGRSMRVAKTIKGREKNSQRWLLAIPIKFNEVTGGMQFQFISTGEPIISETNEKLLERTCTFLGFILELHELSETLFKHQREKILVEDMIKLQIHHCPHDLETLQSSSILYKTPDEILSYNWSPRINTCVDKEVRLLASLIRSRIRHLFKDDMTLNNFILFLKRIHLDDKEICNHILITAHFIIVFLKNNEEYFSLAENDAFVMSAVCHCIHQCEPGYCNILSTIFKMFGINDVLTKNYVDELLANVKRWKYLFPCNYSTPFKYNVIQRKYHKLMELFYQKKFNNHKKLHRELVILAVIINADKCKYYKDKVFISHHDEYYYDYDIGCYLLENELTEKTLLVPKMLKKHDRDEYQNKKRAAVYLLNYILQPWLNILKALFQETEHLQHFLDQSKKVLKEQELEIQMERRKIFFFPSTLT